VGVDPAGDSANAEFRSVRILVPQLATPRGVNRHVSPDARVDLLPAHAAPVELSLVLASAVFIPTIEQPPKVAAASVNLPLLI
jgi:hypothetical protein